MQLRLLRVRTHYLRGEQQPRFGAKKVYFLATGPPRVRRKRESPNELRRAGTYAGSSRVGHVVLPVVNVLGWKFRAEPKRQLLTPAEAPVYQLCYGLPSEGAAGSAGRSISVH